MLWKLRRLKTQMGKASRVNIPTNLPRESSTAICELSGRQHMQWGNNDTYQSDVSHRDCISVAEYVMSQLGISTFEIASKENCCSPIS